MQTLLNPGWDDGLTERWNSASPFRYAVVDQFLKPPVAELLHETYPALDESWSNRTYVHQRGKFSLSSGFPTPIEALFNLWNSPSFLQNLESLTGLTGLLPDLGLVGGGCHQSVNGGFLDVHIDFNHHPVTQMRRCLNVVLYLNKSWREHYGGYLELWDMKRRRRIANIEPSFNRMVVFETTEVSYHGHPMSLKLPDGITRKSLAVYYYSAEVGTPIADHKTRFVNTQGLRGLLRALLSAVIAMKERFVVR